jgi:hypothetical protein
MRENGVDHRVRVDDPATSIRPRRSKEGSLIPAAKKVAGTLRVPSNQSMRILMMNEA